MRCGTSSLLIHVTFVPAFTVSTGGVKLKLSMPISFGAEQRAPSALVLRCIIASCDAASNAGGSPESVASTTASALRPGMNVTLVMPSTLLSFSGSTFIGPGAGAVPGVGCGNAVDIAV